MNLFIWVAWPPCIHTVHVAGSFWRNQQEKAWFWKYPTEKLHLFLQRLFQSHASNTHERKLPDYCRRTSPQGRGEGRSGVPRVSLAYKKTPSVVIMNVNNNKHGCCFERCNYAVTTASLDYEKMMIERKWHLFVSRIKMMPWFILCSKFRGVLCNA